MPGILKNVDVIEGSNFDVLSTGELQIKGTAPIVTIGDGNSRGQIVGVNSNAGGGLPFTICMHSINGTDYYLHVTNAGVLRVSSTLPTTDGAGSAVGGQS